MNRNLTILNKIIVEAETVAKILKGLDDVSFLSNDEKMRAVCMTLINIGELIKNLDDNFREVHKQIPWRQMAGFRDIAAHGYFTLRMEDVWKYASIELPTFLVDIKDIR